MFSAIRSLLFKWILNLKKKMPNYTNGNSKQEHESHLTVMHPCLLSTQVLCDIYIYIHMSHIYIYGYAFYMSLSFMFKSKKTMLAL